MQRLDVDLRLVASHSVGRSRKGVALRASSKEHIIGGPHRDTDGATHERASSRLRYLSPALRGSIS